MPSETFEHTATTPASAAEIWARLQDADTWAGIGPVDEVWDAETAGDGSLVRYRWAATAGMKRFEGRAKVVEARADQHLRMALTSSEMEGSIAVTLEPAGTGTAVHVEMTAASKGFLSSMFWSVVREAIARGLPAQVDEFVANLTAD